jgi:hypothetical protein
VTDFFGTLKKIIQLDYNESSVVLFKFDWFELDGKRLNLKMMAFSKASLFEVYGTRMIVIFCSLKLGRSSICQTQDFKKIASYIDI